MRLIDNLRRRIDSVFEYVEPQPTDIERQVEALNRHYAENPEALATFLNHWVGAPKLKKIFDYAERTR